MAPIPDTDNLLDSILGDLTEAEPETEAEPVAEAEPETKAEPEAKKAPKPRAKKSVTVEVPAEDAQTVQDEEEAPISEQTLMEMRAGRAAVERAQAQAELARKQAEEAGE